MIELEGVVTEALPNTTFKVDIGNGHIIQAHISGKLRMNYLPDGSEINTGDRVITSGLDGVYPKGLLIGTVRSISRTTGEDDRYVVLTPAVDFAHIEEVLIMSTEEAE